MSSLNNSIRNRFKRLSPMYKRLELLRKELAELKLAVTAMQDEIDELRQNPKVFGELKKTLEDIVLENMGKTRKNPDLN